MSRIHLTPVDDLSKAEKALYDRFPANLTLAMLKTKGATDPYLSMGASFPRGAIKDKDRELVILRVGALSKSPYERMQHLPLAQSSGWSDEDIACIEQGSGLDERFQAIIAFVDECVIKVKVSDKVFAGVGRYFDETQVAELTLLVGFYMMTARFLETLSVPLDDGPTSWSNM